MFKFELNLIKTHPGLRRSPSGVLLIQRFGFRRHLRLVLAVLFTFLTLFSPVGVEESFARFKLMGEWQSQTDGAFGIPYPTPLQTDGYRYWLDLGNVTQYPLWRVDGLTMTPITGFTPVPGSIEYDNLFGAGGMVILSGVVSGVLKHWKIEGDDVIPLEPEFGPVPFMYEYLFTRTASGALFSARNDQDGREFWLMNEDGYTLTRDVNPGLSNSHPESSGEWFYVPIFEFSWDGTNPDTFILLRLNDGVHGTEPWVLNTTDQSLTMLADIVEGTEDSEPRYMGQLGNYKYLNTLDRNIYKSDGQNIVSIDDDLFSHNYSSWRSKRGNVSYGEYLYSWWNQTGFRTEELIVRIGTDDSVRKYNLNDYSSDIEVEEIFPLDGEMQIVTSGSGSNRFLKFSDDEIVHSDAFDQLTVSLPQFFSSTTEEFLIQENSGTIYQFDLFCFTDQETVPVWRKPKDFFFDYSFVDISGDWAYVIAYDILATSGIPGGKIQLWGMQWPTGCQEPWIEELFMRVGFE